MQFKDMAELGSLIKAKRKEQGLTQNDLALASNVGIRFIVDIEAGKETAQIGKVLTFYASQASSDSKIHTYEKKYRQNTFYPHPQWFTSIRVGTCMITARARQCKRDKIYCIK